jgi:hypothetical protein
LKAPGRNRLLKSVLASFEAASRAGLPFIPKEACEFLPMTFETLYAYEITLMTPKAIGPASEKRMAGLGSLLRALRPAFGPMLKSLFKPEGGIK